MATLYFNGAVDNLWSTLGNWWMNSGFTVPATALPTSADSVVASANIDTDGPRTVVDFTISGEVFNGAGFGGTLTVTGDCTFNNSANNGILNGDCVFSGPSGNNNGTINGDCIVLEFIENAGVINGNCTFGGTYTYTYGTINGNCIFNDSAHNDGTITGDCVFNGSAHNDGTITGDCVFNDSAHTGGSSGGGTINGNCVFNDGSYNFNGTINGNATFSLTSAGLMISNGYIGSYNGSILFAYEKGINGSSILGVI
jgi:hypothetical protein